MCLRFEPHISKKSKKSIPAPLGGLILVAPSAEGIRGRPGSGGKGGAWMGAGLSPPRAWMRSNGSHPERRWTARGSGCGWTDVYPRRKCGTMAGDAGNARHLSQDEAWCGLPEDAVR